MNNVTCSSKEQVSKLLEGKRPFVLTFEKIISSCSKCNSETDKNGYQKSITLLLQQTQKYSSHLVLSGPLGIYINKQEEKKDVQREACREKNMLASFMYFINVI